MSHAHEARALQSNSEQVRAGMPEDAAPAPAELLRQWRAGDQRALHVLLPLVYEQLRRVARRHLRSEPPGHTLQTTALIHEAYLRLTNQSPSDARDRAHFVALTSNLMRQILVDHARERLAKKRQGGCRVTLTDDIPDPEPGSLDVLAIDAALCRLAELDAQQARIVELRYFGGLSIRETSDVLGISEATVKRDWVTARAWLKRAMQTATSP